MAKIKKFCIREVIDFLKGLWEGFKTIIRHPPPSEPPQDNNDNGTGEQKTKNEIEINDETREDVVERWDKKFYFTNRNWRIFDRFIKAAEKKLDIITGRMSFETFELLFNSLSSSIETRIIVGNTPRNYEKIKNFITERKLKVSIYKCRGVHSKLCISDEKAVLLGSSNMLLTSLGNQNRTGNFEADIISVDVSVVNEACNFFESLWQERRKYTPIYTDCQFLSSLCGIPNKIKELISKTEEELIIFSPNFADKEIIRYIRVKNENIRIKIVLQWPNSSNENNKRALNILRDGKTENGKKLFSISPRRQSIHAKIYVFDKKKALISSVNLTMSSWRKMIETALLTSDKEIIDDIIKKIKQFDYKNPLSIEVKENGGGREPIGIIEIPDEKFLLLETEGENFKNECDQLNDEFVKKYGEDFPESIYNENENTEEPPIEDEKEDTVKPDDIKETPPIEEEIKETPGEIEAPQIENEIEETPPIEEVTPEPPPREIEPPPTENEGEDETETEEPKGENEKGASKITLKITYTRSAIGYNKKQGETVKALGLRRLHQTVEKTDNPCIRGMIRKISHLLKVEKVESEN
ncbi:MAG: 50S ribosomal protein L30 [candidate division Zixibacteria bacterium]|nr:50S ribosomal protein L30 [Candidatus Tariuqbacter arcticus]